MISCTGGPSSLFSFSLQVALSSSLSTLQIKRACVCLQDDTHRKHTLTQTHTELPCRPNVRGGADEITVIQAIGPFIKRQAASIHLIAPGVWKRCHSSVDISSMRRLQAINVCFYKICLYYTVLISVTVDTNPPLFSLSPSSDTSDPRVLAFFCVVGAKRNGN